jgi:hypothetical protein
VAEVTGWRYNFLEYNLRKKRINSDFVYREKKTREDAQREQDERRGIERHSN